MLYAIVCKRIAHPVQEESFMTERQMESFVTIWLDDPDEIEYVNYFYCNKEYTPTWA